MSFADWLTETQQRYRQQSLPSATVHSAGAFASGAIDRVYWTLLSRISPVYTTTLANEQVHFIVDDQTELKRARTALNEQDVLKWLLEPVDDETVFWDVGAYHGTYSAVAAVKGASVVAVEPYGPNATRLAKNAVVNDVHIDQYDVALSDEATTRNFATVETPASELSVTADGDSTVETMRGDELRPRPDVVKIDVEGHELAVLDGMTETLPLVDRIVVEVHDTIEVDAVAERLRLAGLSVVEIDTTRSQTYLGGVRR